MEAQETMRQHLESVGFKVVLDDHMIVAFDERRGVYRVYPQVDPSDFTNAWLEVSTFCFDTENEAVEFVKKSKSAVE